MTRRSRSTSHRSGTTLTLTPPSIRPTERLGGPRTGSGVDSARSAGVIFEGLRRPGPSRRSRSRRAAASSSGRRRPWSGPSSGPPPCGGRRGRAAVGSATIARSAPRRPSARPRRAGVGVLLVDRAGHDHRRRARRPLADQPGEGDEHRRHPPLDVAGPPAVEPALPRSRARRGRSSSRRPGLCPGGRRRGASVAPRARRTGDQVIASRARPPAARRPRPGRGTSLEVVGHPRLEKTRAGQSPGPSG